MEFNFTKVEKNRWGVQPMDDNSLRVVSSGVAFSANLLPFFKNQEQRESGTVRMFVGFAYDAQNKALQITESNTTEGFAVFWESGRKHQVISRVPAALKRMEPAKGLYRLVENASDENVLTFQLEQ